MEAPPFGSPFAGGGLPVGPNEGRIEHHVLVLGTVDESRENALPDARFHQPREALVDALPLAVSLGQPLRAGSEDREDRVDKQSLAEPPGSDVLPDNVSAIRAHRPSSSSSRFAMRCAPKQSIQSAINQKQFSMSLLNVDWQGETREREKETRDRTLPLDKRGEHGRSRLLWQIGPRGSSLAVSSCEARKALDNRRVAPCAMPVIPDAFVSLEGWLLQSEFSLQVSTIRTAGTPRRRPERLRPLVAQPLAEPSNREKSR